MKEGETLVVYIVQAHSSASNMTRIEAICTDLQTAKEFKGTAPSTEVYWVTRATTEPHKE